MAEVLVQFDTDIRADDGATFTPRVCTRRRDDGLWEGWIEYVPSESEGGAPIRTGRETEQPSREEVTYWATGLSTVYLEGALARARDPGREARPARLAPRRVDATPYFDAPAPG